MLDLPIAVIEVHCTINNMNQTGWLRGDEASSRAASQQPQHHMKVIKSSVVLSLLLTLAGGSTLAVRAQDKPAAPTTPSTPAAPAAPKKPVQQQLSGKVIAVDKYGKTVTLQVNNLTYVLQIADATRIGQAGKDRTISDIVVGEEINVTVMLRELSDGRVEVAVLSVDLSNEDAQGRGRGHGRGRGDDKGRDHHGPFHNGPHPPNIDGPVVSPHR